MLNNLLLISSQLKIVPPSITNARILFNPLLGIPSLGYRTRFIDNSAIETSRFISTMSGAGRILERNGNRVWHVVDAKGQVWCYH